MGSVRKRPLENGTEAITGEKGPEVMNGFDVHHPNGYVEPPTSTKSGWSLVAQRALPHFLRDNEFLLNFHRPQLKSLHLCASSIFRIHTETGNIWTHLLGCVGTVFLTLYHLGCLTTDWNSRWSHGVFFIGAIVCLAASTIYHTFLCHSEDVHKSLAKIDYCGVIVLIVSSFAPWVHFGFYCQPFLKTVYLISISALGCISIAVVLNEKFRQPKYRHLRASLFIALGLTGLVPGLHYISVAGFGEAFHIHSWLLLMAFLYILGGVIYAVRLPERLLPGAFDVVFQSHQILHICVLGGVLCCYHGASMLAHDILEVKQMQCPP